jgi:DnaK suppressor protein
MHREALRERLELRAEALREEMAAAIRESALAQPDPPGDADTRILSLQRDAGELEQVLAALQRVDTVDFGRCRDCAEMIDWSRLEAEPQALRCLACQSRAEQASAQRHASL